MGEGQTRSGISAFDGSSPAERNSASFGFRRRKRNSVPTENGAEPFPAALTRALRSTRDHKGAAGSLAPAMAAWARLSQTRMGLAAFQG